VEKRGASLEKILQETVNLIPPTWSHPEITCARVTLNDRIFKTDNFEETIWKQVGHILVSGERVGALEVYYLQERPERDGGPFSKEERDLIGAIAERLGRIIERIWFQEALQKSEAINRAILDAIPDMLFQIRKDGTIQHFEPAKNVEPLLSPRKILGKKISEVMPPDHTDLIMHYVKLTLQTGQTQTFEYQIEINNERYNYEARYVPCEEDEVLVVVRDITHRKQIEEEKEQLFKAISEQREQLQALTGRLIEIQETERKALARELHDQVGQKLTALNLNLNIIRSQLLNASSPTTTPAQPLLDDSLALVEQTTECIQDVMTNLRPSILDDYGLVAALRWYANQLATRIKLIITVQGDEPIPRLGASVEQALFRIAQEALINVVKHAQASQVTIVVQANGTVHLVITDDGLGFESTGHIEPSSPSGWGLITMAERAEAVGGQCRVTSRPGQGTQVIVEVPR
jgi:PAS domain S-box-containing protein